MDFLKQLLITKFKWPMFYPSKLKLNEEMKQNLSRKKLVDHSKYIGIEIEVEQITRAFMQELSEQLWFNTEDGSLRNNGREFVTPPIRGKQIIYSLDEFYRLLPDKADFSDRTSIHIHVNMRNATFEELFNVLMIYLVFEQMLYRFAGNTRYKNIFCVPIQETKLPTSI